MAPPAALVTTAPGVPAPHFPAGPLSPTKHSTSVTAEEETISNNGMMRQSGRRMSSRKMSLKETSSSSNISTVVYSLKRRSSLELGSSTSAKLLNATHESLQEWIRAQRLSHLPPEGSSYDKVLAWAQLFIDRLHSFDLAIEDFAGDSYLAAQLAYGYCALLLELGKENAPALMISFGFFYSMSVPLVNLLERTELFSVSQDIREQLVLALSDLVTLVASVSTHFHKAIRNLTTSSLSINIYGTFPGEIKAYMERCEKTTESMWRHQLLKENMDASKVSEVKTIKKWVAPEDPALNHVVNTLSHLAHDREELTCLYIGPYLTRFLKSPQKSLSITGRPGSGKTVLSSVIVDYLQHPIGGITYNTIYVPINSRIPSEATPRAVAKSILSQLFEKRIGNVQLLQILSEAHNHSMRAGSEKEFEAIVWDAAERALSAALPGSKELILVVDGIDEATCDESFLIQRLQKVVSHGMNLKLITLGAEKPGSAAPKSHVNMNEDLISDDVMAVVRSHFDHTKSFTSMSELDQETVVTNIVKSSHGSFLWAKLATKRVRQESTSESLRKAVDALADGKTGINEFVLRTIQAPEVSEDAKLMLTWLATAERPMSLKELAALASIQVDKNTLSDRQVDVLSSLKPLNSLIFVQDGLTYLRHGITRAAVQDAITKGKLSPSIKDCHADMANRLLFYIKTAVSQQHEPSLAVLDHHDTHQLLNKFPLLDFAVRHWPVHVRKSSAFSKEGEMGAAKAFNKAFPISTTALLLQGALWAYLPTPVRLAYQSMVTHMCRHILTPKSVVTLQSMILLIMLQRQIQHTPDTISMVYEATTISKTLLTTRHTVTMQLANVFIEMTSSQTTSTKTEIMMRREEVLTTLVECTKIQYGQTSETTMMAMNLLVEHYRLVKEEHKAQEVMAIIQSINHADVGGERDGDLHVHLRGRHDKGHRHEAGINLFLDVEERDELIQRSGAYDFEFNLRKAEKYASEKQFELAEHTYVEIWQHVNQEYRSHHSALWEERKLKAVIGYSKFLQTQKRESYGQSILSSVWEEYRHSSMTMSETSISMFQEMAQMMKTTGLTYEALSLLKRCSQYYQSTNRTQSTSYKEIQQSIQSTTKEIMHSVSSSNTMTSETTLEEMVFEASSSISTMDQTSFTATHSLVKLYIAQHRWRDTTRLLKRILRGVWPSLFTSSVQDVMAPTKHLESCVQLAEQLAECYHARRRLTKEEDVRMRIYRAMRSSLKVDNKLRERVTKDLLSFFSRTSREDMVISIRQEMLDDYTEHYGPEHSLVIQMLWDLAQLTRPRPVFVEYYQKIIRALNKDSEICKHEAFEPIVIVAAELWSRGLFSDAMYYYKVLFSTFLKQPKLDARLQDQTFVREIFSRYTHCLRSARAEFSVLYKVTSEYHSQCKVVYGANASITIQATLTLAKVCQESERYEVEAIALYEELLKMKSSEIDHQEVSAILDSIYEEQADFVATSKSVSASSAQTDRAVTLMRKRITSVRETHGWAHEESLSKLSELVRFQSKHQETEKVSTELREASVHILSTEKSSTRLIAAASTIAASYIESNQVHQATQLEQDIYRQIVMKDTRTTNSLKFDMSSRGRESLVFLAQLEHSLHRSSSTITEILASLTTQYVYFEEFRSLTRSKTSSLHQLCVAAARLHQCLITNERQSIANSVFEEFVNYFINAEGKRLKITTHAQVRIFLKTLMDHFSTHKSSNFIRSVGISGHEHVQQLLRAQKYDTACDLALACFTYMSGHDNYRTPEIGKLVLLLGITISGRNLTQRPNPNAHKKMLEASGVILKDVLPVLGDLKINMEQVSLVHLNSLIGLLGELQDYQTLAWLLTILWNSREERRSWPPSITFALARRFIMAKYLVGDSMAAVRLAEDIVYNCRRVRGTRHPGTLEMSVLLSQLYTGMAQRYQGLKAGQAMANRYYKKSAALHENILRVFSDPSYAEMEAGMDNMFSDDGSVHGGSTHWVGGFHNAAGEHHHHHHQAIPNGQYVRQHLHLLKLSLERLGGWPKDYSEYESLNSDIYRVFGTDLKGVDGVEKWNLGNYGSGKAESNDDLLEPEFKNWELLDLRLNAHSHDTDEL
ncbi:NACHT domain protein [Xylariales sp. PMI_506]|nr:NACHT domain protein [Xylariales sp. PMI_506]